MGPAEFLGRVQDQLLVDSRLAEAFEDVIAPSEDAAVALEGRHERTHHQLFPGGFKSAFRLGQQNVGQEWIGEGGVTLVQREAALVREDNRFGQLGRGLEFSARGN